MRYKVLMNAPSGLRKSFWVNAKNERDAFESAEKQHAGYEAIGIKAKLKVWGGITDRHKRTVVAAGTKKRAVELLVIERMTVGYFSKYWCETGNDLELALATEEGVWVNQGHDGAPEFERQKT